jgi:hypothetical protein
MASLRISFNFIQKRQDIVAKPPGLATDRYRQADYDFLAQTQALACLNELDNKKPLGDAVDGMLFAARQTCSDVVQSRRSR